MKEVQYEKPLQFFLWKQILQKQDIALTRQFFSFWKIGKIATKF